MQIDGQLVLIFVLCAGFFGFAAGFQACRWAYDVKEGGANE
jgi:hypothetical protein